MEFEKQYVYKTTLRDVYGMTDSMIAELGEPDKWVKNPHWKSGPQAKLYAIERVEDWRERNRDRLDQALAVREKRSEAARKANATKIAALVEWAETVEIGIEPPASLEEAWEAAERHYALFDWSENRGGVSYGGLAAYMRHNLTNYESLLSKINGRVGGYEAYQVIRERVDQIVEACIAELHRQADAQQSIAEQQQRKVGR